MKTKMNANQIAPMSIASAALLFFASIMPFRAEAKEATSSNLEITAASYRLDNLNSKIEASIRFAAPAISTNEETMVMEAEAASERLEDMNLNLQNSVRYEAPAVDVNAEEMENEFNQAAERLDNLNRSIEESIRFQTPATEFVAGAN